MDRRKMIPPWMLTPVAVTVVLTSLKRSQKTL